MKRTIDVFYAVCSKCRILRTVASIENNSLTVICSACANNLMNKIIRYEIQKKVDAQNVRKKS